MKTSIQRHVLKAKPKTHHREVRGRDHVGHRGSVPDHAMRPLTAELILHGFPSASATAAAAEFMRIAGADAAALRTVLRSLRQRRAAEQPLSVAGDCVLAAQQLWLELRHALGRCQAPVQASTSTCVLSPGTVRHIEPPMRSDVGKICLLVGGLLSDAECERLLERCEARGWHPASLEYDLGSGDMAGESVVNVALRDSDRCILYCEDLAASIWNKLGNMLPQDAFEPLKAVRVNNCFRCLRYSVGQAGFAKHIDGRSVVDGEISRVTIQLYLNDGFKGGATRLCHADDTEDTTRGVDIMPRRGMALVFDQSILHKGSSVHHGMKYTARTEVMYF